MSISARRLSALLAVLAPALLLSATASAAARPTIVLVHGAWAGPAGWEEVVSGLEKDGYATAAPGLDLLSVEGDVATVRGTLDAIPGEKILVAHSYGGFVISNAAFGRADVLGLVYTAAFVPDEGESLLSLAAGYQPPAALGHLVWTATPFASPAFIDPAFFREDFAQELNPKLAAELNAQQRPLNAPILVTPSGPVAWQTIPSWFAISARDRMVDPALQRAEAERMGATTVTFEAASHAGGYTHYASRFVKLIERAAELTTAASHLQ
jgi:pimeloyl-ACP methyl ester carboxylesterase